MEWLVVGAVVFVVAGIAYWRIRRQYRKPRLISFVALTTEPVEIDPAVLASVAGRVWDADLGDGTSEGADGGVIAAGPTRSIFHDQRMYLVNCFPAPYTEDVEGTAESITDLRLRTLFVQHRAWFSCDAFGVDSSLSEEEERDWYRRLGHLFAEFLDERCLMIFLPDTSQAYPITEETEAALRSPDPIAALRETAAPPVIAVSDDDPAMKKAVAEARQRWPEFVAAFEARDGENFGIKVPITRDAETEFIWVSVTAIEGDSVFGTLANEPAYLRGLKLGSKVKVPIEDLNDWCYLRGEQGLVGGFTIKVVEAAARRKP